MKKTTIKKWILPFCLTCVMLTGCGKQMSSSKTDAGSIGGAIEKSTTSEVITTEEATEPVTEITTTEALTTEAESEGTAETAPAEQNETVTLTDESGDFTYTGAVQWIGDEEHGYIQVPADYTPYQDVEAGGLVQYCDGPYNIVTLQRFEGTPADAAASNLYSYMQEESGTDGLTAAEVGISDYTAKQIYAYYTDSSQFMVIWLIPDPDDENSCYYIAMEFDAEHTDMVACSSTFTLHRP